MLLRTRSPSVEKEFGDGNVLVRRNLWRCSYLHAGPKVIAQINPLGWAILSLRRMPVKGFR